MEKTVEKISILIPAYHIQPDIKLVEEVMNPITQNYEIIIQFDAYGEGKGITLQKAFEKSSGDIIVWLDGDMEIHPKHIPKFLTFLDDGFDIIVASKWHPASVVIYPLGRRIISYIGALVIKILFGLPLRDTQTGLKIFRRRVLLESYKIKGYGHDVEVLVKAKRRGWKMRELPIYLNKTKGVSSVNLVSCIVTLFEMIWLWRFLKNETHLS